MVVVALLVDLNAVREVGRVGARLFEFEILLPAPLKRVEHLIADAADPACRLLLAPAGDLGGVAVHLGRLPLDPMGVSFPTSALRGTAQAFGLPLSGGERALADAGCVD